MNSIQPLIKLARLYYLENLTQRQIATKLNLSRMKVHRLLLKAKEEGLIEIKINNPTEDFSHLEIEIEKQYGLKECNIVQASDLITQIYENMGRVLSTILERYLKKNDYLGFGWGTTLRGVTEKVYFNNPLKVNIVPLVGGWGSIDKKIYANSIVTLMTDKIGGKGYILNCPAFVKNNKAKKMFMNEQVVKDIFSLVKNVNTAVVSIGYLGSNMTVRKMNLMKDEELDYLKGLGLIGDINANYIDENGDEIKNIIKDKIINIDLESLDGIKNVIGIGIGEKKVKVMKAALKKKIINILITDSKSAESILQAD